MKIERLIQGSYQTNSYIIRIDENSSECVILDTGLENSALMEYLLGSSLTPEALILTHGHLDHIHGIPELRKQFPAMKVCIHQDDAPALADPMLNLSGIWFYGQAQKCLFSGDSLVAGSIGRTDFPGYQQGKCHQQLVAAVREKVLSLPEDTKVYPGHGPSTTIAQEKRYNPFFEE